MQMSWKFMVGCAIGNLLEWYDFILFGFFASLFSTLFFPNADPFIALLMTFMVFASGCLIRPLAAVGFGHLGDTLGRRKTLVLTIVLITVATTAMGLIPTYQQVGVFAPIALVCCRLVQGAAVSGEEIGAAILLCENAPKHRQALMGSIVLSSVYAGLFLGAVAVLVMNLICTQVQLLVWGWRIPFLISGILGVIALKIRLGAIDSLPFHQLQEAKKILNLPAKQLLKQHKRSVLSSLSVCAILAVAIYLFAVYLPSFYTKYAGFSARGSLLISAFFLLLAAFFVPLIGYLADKKGCDWFLRLGCWGFLIFSYPIFFLLAQHTLQTTIYAELLLVACLSMVAGSLLPIVVHTFPIPVRYSGACLSFNISMTLFGSTAPIIALMLQRYLQTETAPALYLIFASVLALFVLPRCQETVEKNQEIFAQSFCSEGYQ